VARNLIVDGYNLLMGSPRYATDASRDLDAARERLIADLGARAAEGERVTLVFDGASNPGSDGGPRQIGGLTVIFSPSGTDADSVIESLASEAREAREPTTIVTSDAATRWAAMGGSVTVTRATAFSKELDDDERGWREAQAGVGRSRHTVSDRLEGDVRTRLDTMAGRRKAGEI
jgi:predicted RNA-binding protein with PIN domain